MPQPLVESLGLKEGDEVEIRREQDGTLALARDPRRDEALARIRGLSRPVPAGFRFDRQELYSTARDGFRPDDDGA